MVLGRQVNQYWFRNILIVLFFVSLIFCGFLFPNALKNFFETAGRPVWSTGNFASSAFGNVYNFFSLQKNLVARNKILEDQVNTLNLKVIDYDTVQKENQDLKNLLGRKDMSDRILSKVLSRPPQSPYDTLVIDIGSDYDINPGDKVYISDNIIVGIITNVTPHTSLVELFSGSSKKTESVLERTGASYEISGRGGANFSVDVPKDADILWGDVFTYPELTDSVLGSVYYIDTNSQSSFKTIFIRTPGNIFQSEWVFVEK